MSGLQKHQKAPSIVVVRLSLDKGCDPLNGDFLFEIQSISQPLNIEQFHSIEDCINNEFEFGYMREEHFYTVTLKETGEWESGEFWNSYFEVLNIHCTEYNALR